VDEKCYLGEVSFVNLLAKNGQNLAEIDAVVIFARVVLIELGVEEVLRMYIIPVYFPAFDHQAGLRIYWSGYIRGGQWGQAGLSDLIPVPTGLGTQQLQGGMELLWEGAQRESVIFFHETVGVTHRTHHDLNERPPPHIPDTAPANRHGIEVVSREVP